MIQLLLHKKNRNFSRLFVAQLISQFGDRIHQLALVGFIAEKYAGSALGLAKLMSFTILPVFLLQPIAGVLIDRWDRRTTLFVCDIVRGLLVLLIPLFFFNSQSIIPIYIIVFLVFCFPRFHVPAKMAIIPELVDDGDLLKANSLITTTGMIAACLGAAIGAFLIEYFGARNGFFVDAATFFVSSVFVWHINLPKKIKEYVQDVKDNKEEIKSNIQKSVWREMLEGFHYIRTHKDIQFVIQTMFAVFAAAGAIYVVIVVFIQNVFNSVTQDLGVLAISLVAGLFVGVLGFGKWGKDVPWQKTVFGCLSAGGVMLIIFALVVAKYPVLSVAICLSFFWGISIGPIFVATNTVVHIVSDETMRGKVFSALEIVIHAAFLLTMLLSSWLAEFVAKEIILSSVGLGIVVFGTFGLFKHAKTK